MRQVPVEIYNNLIDALYGFKNFALADLDESELADYLVENCVTALPCSPGDTVYKIMADKRIKQPYEYKVTGIWYSADYNLSDVHLARYIDGKFDSSLSVPFSEFGRTIFFTKEEATERQTALRKCNEVIENVRELYKKA